MTTVSISQLEILSCGPFSYSYGGEVWHKVKTTYVACCGVRVKAASWVLKNVELRLCARCFTKEERAMLEDRFGEKKMEEFRTPNLVVSKQVKTTIVVKVDGVKASDLASVIVNDGNVVVTVESM